MKPRSWGRVAKALWHVLPLALLYTGIIQGGAFVIATAGWLINYSNDGHWKFTWLWGLIATWGWIVAGFVTMILVALWMEDNRHQFRITVDHAVRRWEEKQENRLSAGSPTAQSPDVQREVAEAIDPWHGRNAQT